MAQEALDKYQNSYEEDLEILKDETLTFNQRNCVLFRSGEKEILLFFIHNVPKILKLFDLDFKVIKTFFFNQPFYSPHERKPNR